MEKLISSLRILTTGGSAVSNKMEASAKDPASALGSHSTPQPTLEDLPVEVQGLILANTPSLQSLSAFVHASPGLHRVYLGDRLRILRSVVGNMLRGMVVDALGTHHSGTNLFQETRELSLLWAFLKEHEAKYDTAESVWIAQLSFEDAVQLAHFHVLVIEPLAERYASWALASLPTEPEEGGFRQQPLSDTERRRMQHTLYRLQLFCNICGREARGSRDRIENNVDRLRILQMFQPWEVEQILCVHGFFKDIYPDYFRQVAWDLNMDKNPKYRHLSLTATIDDLMLMGGTDGECKCNLSFPRQKYQDDQIMSGSDVNDRSLDGVLRHGPQLLIDTIRTEDHEQLVDRIRDAILSSLGHEHSSLGSVSFDWIEDAVGYLEQEERRERWYSQYDLAQDFRHKMPFNGDDLDSPPLSWVLLWRAEYSNLIGCDYISGELRRWGYVMWDAARLGSRAEARIDYHSWGEADDPRGDYYDDSVRVERPEGNVPSSSSQPLDLITVSNF